MGLNRDKFRKIVGGITTAEPDTTAPADDLKPLPVPESSPAVADDQGRAGEQAPPVVELPAGEVRRFAKRGRPKGRKEDAPAAKASKVKVSLFLSEILVNDLYNWAYEDRVHPGEMFERALKPFHERETKRRNGGKE